MPLKVDFMDGGQGVTFLAFGHLTGSDLIRAVAEVETTKKAASNVLYVFFDFNGVIGVDITTFQLHQLAGISVSASTRSLKGRVVAIYAKDDLPFALTRMWMVFVQESGWETAVFRERAPAIAWVKQRVSDKFGLTVHPD